MIWIGAMSVQKDIGTAMKIVGKPMATIEAANENEAIGICLQMCLQGHPIEDGWFDHKVAVALLPKDFVERGLIGYEK